MYGLRRYFLLDPSITYLNHGSFGATPRPVFQAYQRWQRQLERQPVEFLGRRHNDLMRTARAALGGALGTAAETLVWMTNVTVALNVVARSLDLGPGDEVLSSDHEYGALDRTWRFLAQEHGFRYIHQCIPLPLGTAEDFVAILWRGVTPRTRVIFLSHITSPTAQIFPVAQVCARARREGLLTVIDGAHAPGQIPLQLDELGADFYGGNLHKWLCAPKGAGFLYARPEAQELLKPLVVSWGYQAEVPGPSRFVDHHEWIGTRDISAFLSVPAALRFQERHDWSRVRAACHSLAAEAVRQICALTGQPSLYGGENVFAQMAVAPLPPGAAVAALKTRLYDQYRIEVPLVEWNGNKLVRVSLQGYNTARDVDRLLVALEDLLCVGAE
ncbi:MAG: aminotransferase class V-fold PLP-dependent enzyme [Anaerolineales bacterium]|nr:aminotransferase class V-fold PLP-dependent enzyme [Anaerolineales bacterium]